MEKVLSNLLDLYPHNVASYDKIKNAFSSGMDIVSIVHATGTGKTFNALQLILDNPDKKFIFVTPYVGIIEHIGRIIAEAKTRYSFNLFNNVEFYTYNAISKMNVKDISKIKTDFLILDEFYHIGAPVWGEKIEEFIQSRNDLKVLGISAYTVRDRGTIYERDVTASDSDELFADSVVSKYDLIDAMVDKVLPVPVYRSTHINLEKFINKIEGLINKNRLSEKEYRELIKKLDAAKKHVTSKDEAKELFLQNIKTDGKFIYFCPVLSKYEINDINSVMDEVRGWLIDSGYSVNDFVLYKTTSKDKELGNKNREAFYNDVDLEGKDVRNKLRIMFAINQYNEGIHAPNIDGVILGRETKSDIIFFEQIGRALSVSGDTVKRINELSELSLSELRYMALCKGIVCNYDDKKQLIKRLVCPVVIDLADNIEYIMELENSYKERIKKNKTNNKRIAGLVVEEVEGFDIEVNYHDLFCELMDLQLRFETYTWEDSYELAKNYYNYYKHLDIPRNFRSDDGINYDIYGYRLGDWIAQMRRTKDKLDSKKVAKLEKIGMIWKCYLNWSESYEVFKEFVLAYGIINVKVNTIYKNIKIGNWLNNQKRIYRMGKLTEERKLLLEKLGVIWNNTQSWDTSFSMLKEFYKKYEHINLPYLFKTKDGINYDENGFCLYDWLRNQKKAYKEGKLNKVKIKCLLSLGMDFSTKETKKALSFEDYKVVLKDYYESTGALVASRGKLCNVGFFENVDIARIIDRIKRRRSLGELSQEDIKYFEKLGIKWTSYVPKSWDESYVYAVVYYEEHGHLNVPASYKTSDGYDLGNWIYLQRKKFDKLSDERKNKLNLIEMIWDVKSDRKKVLDVVEINGIDYKKNKIVIDALNLFEFKAKVKYLIKAGISIYDEEGLHELFSISNDKLIELIGIDYHSLLIKYLTKKDKEDYVKSLQK